SSSGTDIAATRLYSSSSTLICGFEFQENRVGQTDHSARRNRQLQVLVALLAVLVLAAGWDSPPVDGGPGLTDVFEEERARAARWRTRRLPAARRTPTPNRTRYRLVRAGPRRRG